MNLEKSSEQTDEKEKIKKTEEEHKDSPGEKGEGSEETRVFEKDALAASKEMKHYFNSLKKESLKLYDLANKIRKKGLDPEEEVEITLAENLAERVIGLISVVAPQIKNAGVENRILELEEQYGTLDWRVAFKIALEISKENFCKFKDKKEAIEVGIRAGFAYVTVGVVSSPLEGFTELNIVKRNDGKGEYFELKYAGPIRNAGGTAAAVSVLIADYVRKHLGYSVYDPTDKEIKRCAAELEDYHNYVTNLQYFPTKEESEFLMMNLPICIAGEASEKYEVSNINLKDIPRIDTNKLRSGYCLIHSSCIPLKAPKLWAKLEEWSQEMGMEQWSFLKEFVKLQKKMKSKAKSENKSDSTTKEKTKISPDYTFIKDIVAGRPVLGYPLRSGGFRLRYGRSRASGYSGQAVNPATMAVLHDFVAIGTQLKVERPGKAAAFTPCDSINGPIVKLKSGEVKYLSNFTEANKVKKEIEEIIYLGDVLINYGDFFDRAHPLAPAGYCEEWWALELEASLTKKIDKKELYKQPADLKNNLDEELIKKTTIPKEKLISFLKDPFKNKPSFIEAVKLSKTLDIPLHSSYLFFWSQISTKELSKLFSWVKQAKENTDKKIVLPYDPSVQDFKDKKRILEILGCEHIVASNEFVVINSQNRASLLFPLNLHKKENFEAIETIISNYQEEDSALNLVNAISQIKIKDKAGTFIGARMGRPEKAKMRKLTGSPHVLFPVSKEGGRLRSFQSVLDLGGFVNAQFPKRRCVNCNIETPYQRCELCGEKTKPIIPEKTTNKNYQGKTPDRGVEKDSCVDYYKVNVKRIFSQCLKKMRTSIYPDLIKGVRGTVNETHIPENLMKGILRAKNNIHVNKDGTVRYDASEITLTHFKPKEVQVSFKKLKELGYTKDIYGVDLESDEQVLELKCQDVVLPCCPTSPDEPADEIFLRVCKFIDELLIHLYDEKPLFNFSERKDLVGQLIIGLAPHTSAGTLGRIIGFSKTQGFLAHPYFHAAMRRDCDGDEACFVLLIDAFLNFSRSFLPKSRGSTMDAPIVLTSVLKPTEVDDMAFKVDVVDKYPLELYVAAENFQNPWEVSIKQIQDVLNTKSQFEGMLFTHNTNDINEGVGCSAYKLLPSMAEKIEGQMLIAEQVRACDETGVAQLVINKHFIRDIKGNLRKFSQQQFRCVACNEKYRRPPLKGTCSKCGGKIIFTISQGSVIKYLQPSLDLAHKYNVSLYLKQDLELTKRRIDSVFGKDLEKQEALGKWV